jgi:hypothetical protein
LAAAPRIKRLEVLAGLAGSWERACRCLPRHAKPPGSTSVMCRTRPSSDSRDGGTARSELVGGQASALSSSGRGEISRASSAGRSPRIREGRCFHLRGGP